MTDIAPSESMTATRRTMDLCYSMEVSPTDRYGASTAKWLAGQLHGRDVRNIGWVLLLVAAMIMPERSPTPSGKGMRAALLSAGQVGAVLIDSAASDSAAQSAAEVGQELAALRPVFVEKAAELWGNVAGLAPDGMMDVGEVARTMPAELAEGFPGADVPGGGWAALGTGVIMSRDLPTVRARGMRGGMLTGKRRQGEQWRAGSVLAAATLVMMGDSLISQS